MKKLTILLCASILALSACAHRDQYGQKKEVNTVATIAEKATAWTLVEWRTPNGKEALLPQRGGPIVLVFEPILGQDQAIFKGLGSCNDVQGLYTENKQEVTMTTHSSTKRVCSAPLMKMEVAFITSLSNTPLQKVFRPSPSGRLMVLSSREGNTWTFVEGTLPMREPNVSEMSPITPR